MGDKIILLKDALCSTAVNGYTHYHRMRVALEDVLERISLAAASHVLVHRGIGVFSVSADADDMIKIPLGNAVDNPGGLRLDIDREELSIAEEHSRRRTVVNVGELQGVSCGIPVIRKIGDLFDSSALKLERLPI